MSEKELVKSTCDAASVRVAICALKKVSVLYTQACSRGKLYSICGEALDEIINLFDQMRIYERKYLRIHTATQGVRRRTKKRGTTIA